MVTKSDQYKDIPKETIVTKDSPSRSIAKALTWRLIASATTFIISFIIFRQVTNMKLSEVVETSTYVTIIDIIAKLFFYYLHERMWTNIKWGKYWKKHYWRGRAWRRLYRKKHMS